MRTARDRYGTGVPDAAGERRVAGTRIANLAAGAAGGQTAGSGGMEVEVRHMHHQRVLVIAG